MLELHEVEQAVLIRVVRAQIGVRIAAHELPGGSAAVLLGTLVVQVISFKPRAEQHALAVLGDVVVERAGERLERHALLHLVGDRVAAALTECAPEDLVRVLAHRFALRERVVADDGQRRLAARVHQALVVHAHLEHRATALGAALRIGAVDLDLTRLDIGQQCLGDLLLDVEHPLVVALQVVLVGFEAVHGQDAHVVRVHDDGVAHLALGEAALHLALAHRAVLLNIAGGDGLLRDGAVALDPHRFETDGCAVHTEALEGIAVLELDLEVAVGHHADQARLQIRRVGGHHPHGAVVVLGEELLRAAIELDTLDLRIELVVREAQNILAGIGVVLIRTPARREIRPLGDGEANRTIGFHAAIARERIAQRGALDTARIVVGRDIHPSIGPKDIGHRQARHRRTRHRQCEHHRRRTAPIAHTAVVAVAAQFTADRLACRPLQLVLSRIPFCHVTHLSRVVMGSARAEHPLNITWYCAPSHRKCTFELHQYETRYYLNNFLYSPLRYSTFPTTVL